MSKTAVRSHSKRPAQHAAGKAPNKSLGDAVARPSGEVRIGPGAPGEARAARGEDVTVAVKGPVVETRRQKARPDKPRTKGGIKVRAIDVGVYDNVRRRVDDVFIVHDLLDSSPKARKDADESGEDAPKQKVAYTAAEIVESASWMVRVDPKTPEKLTTIEEAQKVENDRIKMRLGIEPNPIGAESH